MKNNLNIKHNPIDTNVFYRFYKNAMTKKTKVTDITFTFPNDESINMGDGTMFIPRDMRTFKMILAITINLVLLSGLTFCTLFVLAMGSSLMIGIAFVVDLAYVLNVILYVIPHFKKGK